MTIPKPHSYTALLTQYKFTRYSIWEYLAGTVGDYTVSIPTEEKFAPYLISPNTSNSKVYF